MANPQENLVWCRHMEFKFNFHDRMTSKYFGGKVRSSADHKPEKAARKFKQMPLTNFSFYLEKQHIIIKTRRPRKDLEGVWGVKKLDWQDFLLVGS